MEFGCRIDFRRIGKRWSLVVGLTLEVRRSGGAYEYVDIEGETVELRRRGDNEGEAMEYWCRGEIGGELVELRCRGEIGGEAVELRCRLTLGVKRWSVSVG